MHSNPFENPGKSKLTARDRTLDKAVSFIGIYIDVETVTPQKNVSRGEGNPLVPIDEAVVHA